MKKIRNKKGVSLVIMVVTVIVMIILAGTIIITSYSSYDSAKLNMFATELTNIKTGVDNYYLRYNKYPVTEDIEYTVPSGTNDFIYEEVNNGKVTLKEIDLAQIGVKDTEFGNKKETLDVYALSQVTGNVYYLKGFEYNSKVYYTLNEDLAKVLELGDVNALSFNEIKEYDVIFSVSTTKPTNLPVTAIVKIPSTATVNTITATNNKVVSSEVLDKNYKIYRINETGDSRNGNYDITVNYTLNGATKDAKYSVTNSNNTNPIISYTTKKNNGLRTVTVNVIGYDISELKYETNIINDTTYFVNYGKNVNGNSFVIPDNSLYTIYAKDINGNSSIVSTTLYEMNEGDYVEYDVAYSDVYYNENIYSTLNGWRVLDATLNQDGTYTNVNLISTGIPATLHVRSVSQNFWETDSLLLTSYKNFLQSFGDHEYQFYTGENEYVGLEKAAGLFYNFGDAVFKYTSDSFVYSYGSYLNIISNEIKYNGDSDGIKEATGTTLFNVLGKSKANVRLITLPEVNIKLGRTDIDNIIKNYDSNADSKGLVKLDNLTNVPNMENFTMYNGHKANLWIASPYASNTESDYIVEMYSSGGFQELMHGAIGVRPVIDIKKDKIVRFADLNNNGVPEIVIAN